MNRIAVTFLSFICFVQISCATTPMSGPLVTLEATVINELGQPIEGAEIIGIFRTVSGKEIIERSLTDEEGRASISENTPFSTYMRVEKSGYYQSVIDRIDIQEPSGYGELTPRSYSFNIVLREKINPQTLVAKRGEFKIPVKNEWVGYDLETSDWVKPYGTGESQDVLFRYENEFLGLRISESNLERARLLNSSGPIPWTEEREKHIYGNWSGRLEIKFAGEDEGIVKVVDGYLEHSDMKMPHLAPEQGYQSSASWDGSMPSKNLDLYQGYFLRLRVVKRGDEIIQANYAKLNEELNFDPRGTVSFSYYFNPKINDRNLEFDTSKNLLKNLSSKQRVRLP
jgi:hypothetical protein